MAVRDDAGSGYAQYRRFESLRPVLQAEWARTSPEEQRRPLVRLWAAGLVGQELLHPLPGGAAITPVGRVASESLDAAWAELGPSTGRSDEQALLRKATAVGEHVLSLMLAAPSFRKTGYLTLTKTRMLLVPVNDLEPGWSLPLDGIDSSEVTRGRRGLTLTLRSDAGEQLSPPLRCLGEEIDAWRLAFRLRHILGWRSPIRESLRDQLAADANRCRADGLITDADAETARLILAG